MNADKHVSTPVLVIAVGLSACVASSVVPEPAYAASAAGKYQMRSNESGKCLSLSPTVQFVERGQVTQWHCDIPLGVLAAKWLLIPTGKALNSYTIVSLQTGKCLEAADLGGPLWQSRCKGGDNQTWVIDGPPTKTGKTETKLRSLLYQKCINAVVDPYKGPLDGALINLQDCANIGSQIWLLEPTDGNNPPHDTGKGELCDSCDPQSPYCKSGSECLPIIANSQWVCTQPCSIMTCPTGYICAKVSGRLGETLQCIPAPPKEECPPLNDVDMTSVYYLVQ